MIGHCGGLRESQLIGDYVLAHAYLRDDHVLMGAAAGYPDPEHRRSTARAV
jgi:AMP nucleosidase